MTDFIIQVIFDFLCGILYVVGIAAHRTGHA